MQFNPQTNRIINGICEYCGIPATSCEHYRDGAPKPLDEVQRLELSEGAPVFKAVGYEPLRDDEKAKSVEEAKAKMEAVKAESEVVTTPPAETPAATPAVTKKGKSKK